MLNGMRISTLAGVLVVAGSLGTTALQAQKLSADGAAQTFGFVSDQYFADVYFKFQPTTGTYAGLHQYDTQLEDYSAAGIARQIAALHEYDKKVEAIDAGALDAPVAADRQILLNNIKSQLLSLEVIRPWEKNPDTYSSGITNSAFVIMERPYAPANTRLRALIEREKQMPRALEEARKNLKNPPRIFTEIALEQIDGNISFFKKDVPAAFAEVTDKALIDEFKQTNDGVIAALAVYKTFLQKDLTPKATGAFAFVSDVQTPIREADGNLLIQEFASISYTGGLSATLRTPEYAYTELESSERELYDMRVDPYQMDSLHRRADPALLASLSARLAQLTTCHRATCRN